jgi:hypothetical protein
MSRGGVDSRLKGSRFSASQHDMLIFLIFQSQLVIVLSIKLMHFFLKDKISFMVVA